MPACMGHTRVGAAAPVLNRRARRATRSAQRSRRPTPSPRHSRAPSVPPQLAAAHVGAQEGAAACCAMEGDGGAAAAVAGHLRIVSFNVNGLRAVLQRDGRKLGTVAALLQSLDAGERRARRGRQRCSDVSRRQTVPPPPPPPSLQTLCACRRPSCGGRTWRETWLCRRGGERAREAARESRRQLSSFAYTPPLRLPSPRDSFFCCSPSPRGYSGVATFVRTGVALPFAAEARRGVAAAWWGGVVGYIPHSVRSASFEKAGPAVLPRRQAPRVRRREHRGGTALSPAPSDAQPQWDGGRTATAAPRAPSV